jgi:hypothetical protein
MSFKSDLTGVLQAEIGISASLLYKKCMLQLKKDPSAITQSDLEEIATWAYEEIQKKTDVKTATRVRQQILQIQILTTPLLKRPFSPRPVPKRLDDRALLDTIKNSDPSKPGPAVIPVNTKDIVPEHDFSDLVSKSLEDLQKKISMAPASAPAKTDSVQEHNFSGLVGKSLTELPKKKSVAAAPVPASVPSRADYSRPEPGFSTIVSKTSANLPIKNSVAAAPVPASVPSRADYSRPEPGFSTIVSKTSANLPMKNSVAAAPVQASGPSRAENSTPEPDFSTIVSKTSANLPKKSAETAPLQASVPSRAEKTTPEPDFSAIVSKTSANLPKKSAETASVPGSSEDFFISSSKQQPEAFKGSVDDLMEEEETEPEETPAVDRTDMKPVTLANQIADCNSRIETDSDNAGFRIELADLYMRSGKFRESTQAYRQAIDLGIETPAIWNSLGDSYKKTGQYEDSDAAYARSLELNPDNPVVWLKRAKVQASRNKYADSLASCDQSLTLDDTSVAAWHYKAFVLKKVGRNEEALEIYTYLRQLDPKDENAARQEVAIRKLLK